MKVSLNPLERGGRNEEEEGLSLDSLADPIFSLKKAFADFAPEEW